MVVWCYLGYFGNVCLSDFSGINYLIYWFDLLVYLYVWEVFVE